MPCTQAPNPHAHILPRPLFHFQGMGKKELKGLVNMCVRELVLRYTEEKELSYLTTGMFG